MEKKKSWSRKGKYPSCGVSTGSKHRAVCTFDYSTGKSQQSFTVIKIGYTKGIYGCSGEYFNCIVDMEKGFFFHGMYGAEQRVAHALKDKGYKEIYTQSVYGRMVRDDIPKNRFMSEYTAIEEIKTKY